MSDSDEYSYEYSESGGEGGGGSGEESGSGEDDVQVQIENTFCDAEEEESKNPAKAVEMYDTVVRLERERDGDYDYSFKSLKQTVALTFQLGDYEGMTRRYEDMLGLVDKVTSNECTDGINFVLDTVATCSDVSMLGRMYEITLTALQSARSERLLFSINVRKAKLHLKAGEYSQLATLIRGLHRSCQLPDGTDDPSKSTNLMEMYALEIQLCEAQGNRARMKEIYPKVRLLISAIADPRIMGIVHESFGKMHMAEQRYTDAHNEFFDAFKNYQEAGRQASARTALRYLLLANMLAKMEVNPMDSREAKVYKDDKEIMAMEQLRMAYTRNDIARFEVILRDKSNHILDDPFIHTHLADLLATVRSVAVTKIVAPYTSVRLAFLARELSVTVPEVEQLCVKLILDGQLPGATIDQLDGCLQLGGARGGSSTYEALAKWTEKLEGVRVGLETRLA